jgi:hypothetical protein
MPGLAKYEPLTLATKYLQQAGDRLRGMTLTREQYLELREAADNFLKVARECAPPFTDESGAKRRWELTGPGPDMYLPNLPTGSALCMHETCPACSGGGVREDGSMCVHMISCSCKKCAVYC